MTDQASSRPSWASRPVPPGPLETCADVTRWTWESPERLRGEQDNGCAFLVVTAQAPDGPRSLGQAITPDTSAERVSQIYADLHRALARDIAEREAKGHRGAGRDSQTGQ